MLIQAKFTYRGDMHCETPTPDGRGVLSITPAMRSGAAAPSYSPMDLLALAHGTCLAMMMGKAAKGAGLDIGGMTVEMALEMAEGTPPRVGSVKARFVLPRKFAPGELAKLKAGAEMCPVHRALRPEIPVTLELITPE